MDTGLTSAPAGLSELGLSRWHKASGRKELSMTDLSTQTLPAMTGAEMQSTREFLGLSLGWLSRHMTMNERRMMRMETGQESIPDGLVTAIDEMSGEANELVSELIAKYRRQVKATPDEPVTVTTYRTDKDYESKYPARWHRMVCARVCQAVPGLVIVYSTD